MVMMVTCVIPSSCVSEGAVRTAVQCYVRCMSEEKDNRGLKKEGEGAR